MNPETLSLLLKGAQAGSRPRYSHGIFQVVRHLIFHPSMLHTHICRQCHHGTTWKRYVISSSTDKLGSVGDLGHAVVQYLVSSADVLPVNDPPPDTVSGCYRLFCDSKSIFIQAANRLVFQSTIRIPSNRPVTPLHPAIAPIPKPVDHQCPSASVTTLSRHQAVSPSSDRLGSSMPSSMPSTSASGLTNLSQLSARSTSSRCYPTRSCPRSDTST